MGQTPSINHLLNDTAKRRCLAIAHRGASFYAPENTLPAFRLAIEMQADMIELDITSSRDGVPVIFHDVNLNKKSTGKGAVTNRNLNYLQSLDTGRWFNKKFAGTRMLTLQEFLDEFKGKICLNVEIKKEVMAMNHRDNFLEKVLSLAEHAGMTASTLFTSFSYECIGLLKKINPGIFTGILYNEQQSKSLSPLQIIGKYGANTFNCSFRELQNKWITELKSENIPVLVYTINTEGRMKTFINRGVAGIFTDKPGLLKKISAPEDARKIKKK